MTDIQFPYRRYENARIGPTNAPPPDGCHLHPPILAERTPEHPFGVAIDLPLPYEPDAVGEACVFEHGFYYDSTHAIWFEAVVNLTQCACGWAEKQAGDWVFGRCFTMSDPAIADMPYGKQQEVMHDRIFIALVRKGSA